MGNNETIGAKIVTLRKAKGCTQAELGAYLNISYQAVSKWERGESCPDFVTMSKLAQYFGVSLTYFEDNEGVEEKNAEPKNEVEIIEEEKIVCPFCGKPTSPQEKFCEACEGYIGEKAKDCEKIIVSKEKETEKEPIAETLVVEVEPKREMLGICKMCGKVVYKGDEWLIEPTILCKKCHERKKKEQEQRAAAEKRRKEEEIERARQIELQHQEAFRRKRNKGFIVGGFFGGAVCILLGIVPLFLLKFVGEAWLNLLFWTLVGGVVFTFVSQMVWNGAVRKCALAGGAIIGTPGIIFTFDLDGFIFLIAMKILFAVLRFTVYILSVLFMVGIAMIISPFTFVPALIRVNQGIDA